MKLLERTLALKRRAEALGDLQFQIEEASLLQRRLDEVTPAAAGLAELSEKVALLGQAGLRLSFAPDTVGSARTRLDRVRTRFAESRTAAALTKGRDWERLISDLKEAARAVRSELQALWTSHVDDFFTGEPPAQMSARLAKTDKNKEALSRYSQAFAELNQLAGGLPETLADVERAKEVAHRLGAIARDFELDVPASIKAFLDAVALGGAPFNLVTEEVCDWLERNGLTDRYKVVAVRT
jgi:hypothetical protein